MLFKIKTLSFHLVDARKKLTRLGLCLFYLYLYLVIAAYAGMIYAGFSIVLKFIPHSRYQATSVGQAILLIFVCWLMAKLFLRESYHLLEKDDLKPIVDWDEDKLTPEPKAPSSNVIPFKRKSPWE